MSFYEGNSFADDSEDGPVSAFPFKAPTQSAFGAAASSAFAPKNGASAPARASHPQRAKDDDCEEASFHSSQYDEEASDDEHENSEDSYDEDEEDETQDSGSSQDASDYTDEEGEDEEDDEERSGAYPHDERSHSGSCVDDCGNVEEQDENDRGSAASAEDGEEEDDEDDGYNDNTSEQFHSEEGENEDEEGEAAHESVSAANAPNATSAFGALPTAHSAFKPAFAPAVSAPPTRAQDVAAPTLGTAWGTPTSSTAHAGISKIAAFSASGGGGTGTSGTSPATQPQGFVSLFNAPTGAGAARQPPAPPFAGVMEAHTKASNDAPVATATTPTPLAPSSVATSTAAAPAAAFSSSCVHGTSAPAANLVESMVVDQGRAPRYESIPWKSATTASTRNAGKRFRSEAEEMAAVSALLARFEPAVPTERFDEQVRAVLESL